MTEPCLQKLSTARETNRAEADISSARRFKGALCTADENIYHRGCLEYCMSCHRSRREERSLMSVNEAEGVQVVITQRKQLFLPLTHIPLPFQYPQATINTAQPDSYHRPLGGLHPCSEVHCQRLTNTHLHSCKCPVI